MNKKYYCTFLFFCVLICVLLCVTTAQDIPVDQPNDDNNNNNNNNNGELSPVISRAEITKFSLQKKIKPDPTGGILIETQYDENGKTIQTKTYPGQTYYLQEETLLTVEIKLVEEMDQIQAAYPDGIDIIISAISNATLKQEYYNKVITIPITDIVNKNGLNQQLLNVQFDYINNPTQIVATQELIWSVEIRKHIVQSNTDDKDKQEEEEDLQNILLAPIQVLTHLSSVEYTFSEECKTPICGNQSIKEGRWICIINQDDEKDLITLPLDEDLCTLFQIPKPTFKSEYTGKKCSLESDGPVCLYKGVCRVGEYTTITEPTTEGADDGVYSIAPLCECAKKKNNKTAPAFIGENCEINVDCVDDKKLKEDGSCSNSKNDATQQRKLTVSVIFAVIIVVALTLVQNVFNTYRN